MEWVSEYRPEEGAVSIATELCYVKYSMLAQTPADCTVDGGLEPTLVCHRQTTPPAG